MLSFPTKIYKDISEDDAHAILEEDAKIGFPPVSGNPLRCMMIVDCSYIEPQVSIDICDDASETEWEVNVNTRRMFHRGYGQGCFWVEFGGEGG